MNTIIHSGDAMDDFNRFWQAYPRRVAKAAARREFAKAILKAPIESILAGVEAYKRNKPDYQDWAHARTWLYNERWEDEWEGTEDRTGVLHIPTGAEQEQQRERWLTLVRDRKVVK